MVSIRRDGGRRRENDKLGGVDEDGASDVSDTPEARAARALAGSPFLNVQQAAHYLGVSIRTLQDHRSRGTGPRFRRHFRRIRYHIDDLESWSIAGGEAGEDA